MHIALALAAHHRDRGRYPAKLNDLAPKYLPAIPDDLFSGKPLIYRLTDNGYLLYSVGVNGRDDNGRNVAHQKGEPSMPPPLRTRDDIAWSVNG